MAKELRQVENRVIVEGYLKEKNLEKKEATIEVNGTKRPTTSIGGDIVVSANGKDVKVRMYQKALKKDGTPNGIYAGYETILSEYVSQADVLNKYKEHELPLDWKNEATVVSLVGEFRENAFMGGPNLITDTIVQTTFLNRAKNDFKEKAEFVLEGYFNKIREEKDSEGEETGRLIIELIVTAYGGRTFPINIVAPSGDIANHIEQEYEIGLTGKIWGELDYIQIKEEKITKAGFGKDKVEIFTKSKKELIITGGLEEQYDVDDTKLNLDKSLILKAMNEREVYFDELRSNNNSSKSQSSNQRKANPKDKGDIPF